MSNVKPVAEALVVCPSCGTSVTSKVVLKSLTPTFGYLNLEFKDQSVSHDCPEEN